MKSKCHPRLREETLQRTAGALRFLLAAAFLSGSGWVLAEPSLILTPLPGWNGWGAETKVRAGFRQHGGTAEVVVTDTATLSINPSHGADSVVAARTVSASRRPTSGLGKDKAEGSLGFSYTVGNAVTQDRFSFTLNSTTSAENAKQDFGAGPVPADAFFEAEIILRTYSPINAGVNFQLPDMPTLSHPATETMLAVFSGWSNIGGVPSPISGYLLPGDAGLSVPVSLTGVQEFQYKLNYAIVTPYGEDPTVTYTLTGGAAGQDIANVVPNGDFEIAGAASPTTSAAGIHNPSAAEAWLHWNATGTYLRSELRPSTDTLSGSSGNMLSLRTDGAVPGSGVGNRLYVPLGKELPPGSTGTVNLRLVSGSARVGFLNGIPSANTLLPGSATAANVPGWQQLTFTNPGEATGMLAIQLDGPGVAEVELDHVTARAPIERRNGRYDYPGAFGPVTRWISNFAYPNQVPLTGDFDGDGLDDIVTFLRSAYPGQIGRVYVALNTGAGAFNFAGAVTGLWHPFFSINDETPAVGDLDGDGRDDILTFVPGGTVWAALSTGSKFANGRPWYPAGTSFLQASETALTGDVNGDGLTDILAVAGNNVYVSLNTGAGFALRTLWQADFRAGTGIPRVGDVNGDGRDDLVLFVRNSDTARSGDVEVAVSNGTNGFVYLTNRFWHGNFAPDANHEPLLADLNGDGCLDLVAVHNDGRVFAAIQTGGNLFASGSSVNPSDPAWQWHGGIRNPGEKPLVGDFNRDMNADLCTFVFDQRTGADFAATYVTLCGNPTRPLIAGMEGSLRYVSPRSLLALRTSMAIPPGWNLFAKLIGPRNDTLYPVFSHFLDDGAAIWKIPGGDYPSGLYRFIVFDDITSMSSSNSWPVHIENTLDGWRRVTWNTTDRTLASVSGDQADPDGDGLPNFAEYLLGTNAMENSGNAINWSRGGDGSILHTFRVRPYLTGTIQCQYGADPASWNDGEILALPGNSIYGLPINYTLRTPPSSSGKMFARLKFTRYQFFEPE